MRPSKGKKKPEGKSETKNYKQNKYDNKWIYSVLSSAQSAIANRVQSSLYFLFHWSFSLISRAPCATFFLCFHFINNISSFEFFIFVFSYPESYSFHNFLSLISRNTLLRTLNRIIRYYKWLFFFSLWFICINFFSWFFSLSFLMQPKKNPFQL